MGPNVIVIFSDGLSVCFVRLLFFVATEEVRTKQALLGMRYSSQYLASTMNIIDCV